MKKIKLELEISDIQEERILYLLEYWKEVKMAGGIKPFQDMTVEQYFRGMAQRMVHQCFDKLLSKEEDQIRWLKHQGCKK